VSGTNQAQQLRGPKKTQSKRGQNKDSAKSTRKIQYPINSGDSFLEVCKWYQLNFDQYKLKYISLLHIIFKRTYILVGKEFEKKAFYVHLLLAY